MANLLLIESPGKSKKLSQILGPGWIVKASMGHVRELTDDGEDSLGFDLLDDRVECHYEPRGPKGKKVLADLRQAVKQADAVYIATDCDREGETIGWHLQQALRLKNPQRVVYTEITAPAVRQAIARPRPLDQALIGAGRARDCLDKLVGYRGSKHLVWKLNNGAKSMGRVQSATLHLLCLREKEILAFTPQDYWSVWVEYQEGFKAFYRRTLNPKAVNSKSANAKAEAAEGEVDDASDEQRTVESDRITSQDDADRLVAIARSTPHQVVKVESKATKQSPPPPFITSTLQQAAGAKLRLSPEQTMRLAQSLYEAGHITYMRTDSVMLSAQFCAAVKAYLEQHDPANVPQRTVHHRSKQTAQEAHEAIRPTDVNQTPQRLQAVVTAEAAQLYDLIWNRAIASQCAPAQLAKTRVVTQSGAAYWEARGQVLTVPGYTRYWNNISTDTQLPRLQQGQPVTLKQAGADQKQTQPPPRYTEPKLVQLMERKGIGRPSTYAPTVKTLKERTYVQMVKGKLQPTTLGMELDGFLEQVLPDLLQPEFTAQMESALDAIATGQQDWQTYLTRWNRDYFAPALASAIQKLGVSGRTRATTAPSNSQLTASSPPPKPVANLTDMPCPKCGKALLKVLSKSKKLKADHFLSCNERQGGCGSVMFWNPNSKVYELPYAQRIPDAESLTDYLCPICSAFLEKYTYTKEGKDKVMLRCAIAENRKGKCKDVAFFEARTGFWSPKFGELENPSKNSLKKSPK
jgi:DNA topoisomerase I